MKILTLTMNPTIDISSSVANVAANRKLRCKPPRYDPGGGGINVSRAIQHLGGDSTAIFPSGDPTGKVLQNMLQHEGITQEPIPIQQSTRENVSITESSSDQQYRFVMPGPELSEEEWQRCLQTLEDIEHPEFIVASGSLPPGVPRNFYARVAKLAKQRDIKCIVDTKGEALKHAVEEGVYCIKPNVRELSSLAGEQIQDEEQQASIAKRLIEQHQVEFVVVSLGSAGALLVTREMHERINAPIVDIKSKVGAGDSMVAGLVYSLVQGTSIREAAMFGIAAGTAAVKTAGSELCHKADVEQLYKSIRNN